MECRVQFQRSESQLILKYYVKHKQGISKLHFWGS